MTILRMLIVAPGFLTAIAATADEPPDVLPPVEPLSYVLLQIQDNQLLVTEMAGIGPYKQTEERYSVQTPVIVQRNGETETEFVEQQRVRVVMKPTTYEPATAKRKLKDHHFQTADGKKLDDKETARLLKKATPAVLLRSNQKLPAFFRAILKPGTIIASENAPQIIQIPNTPVF